MHKPSRRSFVAGAAALPVVAIAPVVASAATTTGGPDAELIAVCAEHDRLHQQIEAAYEASGLLDKDPSAEVTGPLFRQTGAVIDRMFELRATTAAGIQARAHSLAVQNGRLEHSFDWPETWAGKALGALLRDAAAIGGSDVKLLPSPDAELIRLCAEADALEHSVRSLYTDGSSPIEDDAERDRAQAPLEAQQKPLFDRICCLRATTLEGHVARARTLRTWAPDFGDDEGGSYDSRLLGALLRDMLADDVEDVRDDEAMPAEVVA